MLICLRGLVVGPLLVLVLCSVTAAQRGDTMQRAREVMVQNEVIGRGIQDPRVWKAMREVPRHLFVPADQRRFAYSDSALPIGEGQTITSPFVVSYMTDKLETTPTDKVLEIGTGSGYQASVLSHLVADVYTIEIVEPLGLRAAKTIERLGYGNIHTRIGDGYKGWPEEAPFDKIIVTCSPEKVPPALVNQLKDGGLLVVPLGERFQQTLFLFRKVDGQLKKERLESTFFVPMTGRAEQLRIKKGDTGIPTIVNGDFEQLGDSEDVPGWFYARQASVVQDDRQADGHVLLLTNRVPGESCHLLQAIGVDGRKVSSIELSVTARLQAVAAGRNQDWLPRVEVTFYDDNRQQIRTTTVGPWTGTSNWTRESKTAPVPRRARLAVVVIAMFGATGQFAVDDITIQTEAVDR